jgi:hypothetical protein
MILIFHVQRLTLHKNDVDLMNNKGWSEAEIGSRE